MFDDEAQTLASFICIRDDRKAFANNRGNQRRRCRREDEAAPPVHEKIAKDCWRQNERSFASQRLPARYESDDIFASMQMCSEPAPLWSAYPDRMRIVDEQHGPGTLRQGGKIVHGRYIAVHAVKRFEGDPRCAASALRPPSCDRVGCCIHVVMRKVLARCPRHPHALVHAGMDQFIVQDEVARLWQGGDNQAVRGETRADEQRTFTAEETGSIGFQTQMFSTIAAQQTRPTGPRRDASCQRVHGCGA